MARGSLLWVVVWGGPRGRTRLALRMQTARAGRKEREVSTVYGGKRIAMRLLSVVLTASAFACTSARTGGTTARSLPANVGPCFNARDVDSFSPLHGRFVYVRLLGGAQFLLTLDSLYTDLPFATGITISSTLGQVCPNSGAALTFTNLGRRVSARILFVEAVDSKDAAQALVNDRTPH